MRRIGIGATGAVVVVLAGASAGAGCGRHRGKGDDPATRMFESSYSAFIAEAGAQKAGCDVKLAAKGDAGKKKQSETTSVEVDDAGDVHVVDGDVDTLRVGGETWETVGPDGKRTKLEAGDRADLVRDEAVVGWRTLLAPFRDRIKLAPAGSQKLGSRGVKLYDLSGQAGGGNDGGPKLDEIGGTVGLDEETGFPVSIDAHAKWDAPAPAGNQGRVDYDLSTLQCGVKALGGVPKMTDPDATPTPAPAATSAAAAPTAKPAKPAATPKKKSH